MFHIFLLFIRTTLAFKNERRVLADKSLINDKHGSMFPRAWCSYSFLSVNWLDIHYKYPMSSKLPANVSPNRSHLYP